MAAPTDNADIVLLDQHGIDVLQGLGQDVDQAATTSVPILYSGTSIHPCVDEDAVLRLRVGDNLVASAQLTITIYFGLGV